MTATLRLDAEDAQKRQSLKAKTALYDYGTGIPWPWDAVTQAMGKIQRGNIHVIAGPSGNGKTTFAASAALLWILMGVTVIYGGFERATEDLRRYFAAMALGLHPGKVLSGRWEDDADFLDQFKAMERVLAEMASGQEPWDRLHFIEDDHVSPASIANLNAMAMAHDDGLGSVIVVDHIDHLGPGRSRGLSASQDVVTSLHSAAKKHRTRWVVFSQINNRELNKSGVDLARHRPMPVSAISQGQSKEEVSWTVSCLFQPLNPSATPDQIKAVTHGTAELSSVLWQGVTCLALLKDRDMGAAGKKTLLGWETGRIVDAPDEVKRQLEAKQHGIRTAPEKY